MLSRGSRSVAFLSVHAQTRTVILEKTDDGVVDLQRRFVPTAIWSVLGGQKFEWDTTLCAWRYCPVIYRWNRSRAVHGPMATHSVHQLSPRLLSGVFHAGSYFSHDCDARKQWEMLRSSPLALAS